MTIMTFDDRRLSRCLHMLAIAIAVVALAMFLPAMTRLVGDDFTAGASLSVAAAFVGLPAMIGLAVWSDRSSTRTPAMSTYLSLCALLAAGTITLSVRIAVAGSGVQTLVYPFGALGISIALSTAAAFIRDRGHVATVA